MPANTAENWAISVAEHLAYTLFRDALHEELRTMTPL